MKFTSFEEIIAWQRARELTILIYKLYRNCKDYSFRDQIQRAVVSIMNNIAEGYERKSNKELKQFFYIAKGSAGEVRSMNYLASDLRLIDESDFIKVREQSIEISRILSGLIKSLKE